MWAGCIVFVFIELYCLYRSVRYERDELWGTYSDGPVSERSAWTRGIAYYLLAFALFVIARIAIGDPMLLTLTMSTNFMVAVFPLLIVQRRRSRWGGSIVLGWFVIVGTLFTFAPHALATGRRLLLCSTNPGTSSLVQLRWLAQSGMLWPPRAYHARLRRTHPNPHSARCRRSLRATPWPGAQHLTKQANTAHLRTAASPGVLAASCVPSQGSSSRPVRRPLVHVGHPQPQCP